MKNWKPFNSVQSTVASRVLEALIVAAVVAGITLYGNYRVIDIQITNLCATIGEVKADLRDLAKKLDRHIMGDK